MEDFSLLARPQAGTYEVTHRVRRFRIGAQTDWPERHRHTMEWMSDAEAAARVIIDILAMGDLDTVSSAVAEEYIDHQGLGDVEIRGCTDFAGLWRRSTSPLTCVSRSRHRRQRRGPRNSLLGRGTGRHHRRIRAGQEVRELSGVVTA